MGDTFIRVPSPLTEHLVYCSYGKCSVEEGFPLLAHLGPPQHENESDKE